MVNIGSQQENDFITAKMSDNSWVGLREVADNLLKWIDDGTSPVYSTWIGGYPSFQDNNKDCVVVETVAWRTRTCDHTLPFVCESGKKVTVCYFSSNFS